MLNKKAQVGETVTWIVATVIIIVILTFFIFGASMLGEKKNIKIYRPSIFSESSYQGDDLFLKKSLFTYYSVSKDFSKKYIENKLFELEAKGKFKSTVNETRIDMMERLQ